jgi:hypothetical protein
MVRTLLSRGDSTVSVPGLLGFTPLRSGAGCLDLCEEIIAEEAEEG